ncbi:HAD-IIB family hydrolase [Solibacillus silvestris]|uniref:HAD-IIB family hydrolase n=1 Tax=Solibacillus silvestris TaxID=76853 RepID=UPI003F7FF6A9
MNFVFDIDGTLCFDGKTIEQPIIEALHKISNDGHTVIFASARPIRDLVPVLPESFKRGKLIGGNGCFISDHEHITAHTFTPELMTQLHTIINEHKLTYLADGKWDYTFTGNIEHPIYKNINQDTAKNLKIGALQEICKLVLFEPHEALLDELSKLPLCVTAYKNENAIDISPFGINKVYGLEKLQVEDFIAFGNDSNDQCMFEKARFSVCIGQNEVQKYASVTIKKEEVARMIVELGHEFN